MFKWILVPLDGLRLSEGVIPYARQLALGLQLPVTLAHVVRPDRVTARAQRPPTVEQLSQWATDEGEALLWPMAASLRAQGVSVHTRVLFGRAAESLLDSSAQAEGCLIAMATHGRSGVGRWILGSVTDKVLHHTSDPMLLVRPPEGAAEPGAESLRSLLVPLDGSTLAESILPQAETVARGLGLRVILLQAVPSVSDLHLGPDSDYYPYPSEILDQAQAAAEEYLRSVAQGLSGRGLQVETRLLHGRPAAAIIDLAQETPDSVIAMSTHGRSGLTRWLLGSVADKVVRSSSRPVLLVRQPPA